MIRAPLLVVLAGLAGCTHIESRPGDRHARTANALRGAEYSLPMVQYEVKLTRTLVDCPASDAIIIGGGSAGKTTVEVGAHALAIKIDASATRRYVAGETFQVDPRTLRSAFKTSSFGLKTYPSGTLQSINVGTEDHTADVVKAVVKTGLAVATLVSPTPALLVATAATGAAASGGPFGIVGQGASGGARPSSAATRTALQAAIEDLERSLVSRKVVGCRAEVEQNVKALREARSRLPALTRALEDATARAERASVVANLKAADRTDALALGSALSDLRDTALAVQKAQVAINEASTALQVASQGVRWPSTFDEGPRELPPMGTDAKALAALLEPKDIRILTPEVLAAWLKRHRSVIDRSDARGLDFAKLLTVDGRGEESEAADTPCAGEGSSVAACIAALGARIELVAADAAEDCDTAPGPRCRALLTAAARKDEVDPRDARADPGIFVRPPREAVLRICRREAEGWCRNERPLLEDAPVMVPQMGQLRFMEFSNGAFESGDMTLAVREDGSLENYEYKRTKAAAVDASSVAQDAVEQYAAYRGKRDERLKTAREQRIAEIQFQIDELTKQKELLALRTPSIGSTNTAVNEETAAIQARVALLNAQLAELQAKAAFDAAN